MIRLHLSRFMLEDIKSRMLPSIRCYCIPFLFFPALSQAQSEIPLGTWRLHISYNNINSISLTDQKVFGASQNGIIVLDRLENSISTFSKMNGLQGTEITYINYDGPTDQLLVAYADGKLDRIKNNTVNSSDPARNSTVTGSKKINHISIRSNRAYLSTDYGVVIFDLARGDIKETWRDIGANGQPLKIFQSTFKGDSIFLATGNGVIAGDLNNNLLDFNYWKRFDTGNFSIPIQTVEVFDGKVYIGIQNDGLYRYEFGVWTKEVFLQNEVFRSLNASATNLFISTADKLWKLSSSNDLMQIADDVIAEPYMAIEDVNDQLWIADGKNGIVSNSQGTFVNHIPNGPSNPHPAKLAYGNKFMYALGGGYSSSNNPLNNPGVVDQFIQGAWSTQNSSMPDLTDITFNNADNLFYVSSFGYGVEAWNGLNRVAFFNESNSPLVNTNSSLKSVTITSIEQAADGLWVANHGASQPLHFLTNENTWESFSFPYTASRYPRELVIDFYNTIWLMLDPEHGGGVLVFNRKENLTKYLTDIDGAGGLPNKSVHSMAIDRDGIAWLGTDEGVAYFADPSAVFSAGINAVRPIFDSRFLLRDDKVTAIAIDGGNRKWIGTERGVWLFNSSVENLIYNFTADNSPLLSNVILDIEVNPETGEVFFATDQGLASFRADATESNSQFQTVKIFPNPVIPDFNGTVGISGLATDAIVKITDIAGKLVWESQANGGTAFWNIKDHSGRRASSGVYLVFSASADGAESVVGKIAVVK